MKRDIVLLFIVTFSITTISIPNYESLSYDEALYINIARNLANNILDFTYQNVYMLYRPPVYVYTISLPIKFLENDLHLFAAKIVSAFFHSLTSILVYIFSYELFKKRTYAFISSLIYFLNPVSFTMATRALTHTEFTFFSLLSLYLFYRGEKTGRNVYIYFSAIASAIAFLTRYVGVILLISKLCYLIYKHRVRLILIKKYYIYSIIFFITTLPWMIVSWKFYDSPIKFLLVAIRVIQKSEYIPLIDSIKSLILASHIYFLIIISLVFLGAIFLRKNELILIYTLTGIVFVLFLKHKELRYITFLTPLLSILIATSLKYIGERFSKILPILLSILILMFSFQYSLEYKERWDNVYRKDVYMLKDLKKEITNITSLGVDPKLYTISGYVFYNVTIYQILENFMGDVVITKKNCQLGYILYKKYLSYNICVSLSSNITFIS